jgi:hypothetical protein
MIVNRTTVGVVASDSILMTVGIGTVSKKNYV